MARILVTSGRAPAALELCRLFHRQGHDVFVAESVPVHLCRSSKAVAASFRVPAPADSAEACRDALARIVSKHSIDLVVPVCEEIFHIAHNISSIPCPVFCEPIERLELLHDKYAFIKTASSFGLPVPETILVSAHNACLESVTRDGKVVLKPRFSRFSARVMIDPTPNEAQTVLAAAGGEWVVQRLLRGRQLCSYTVCHRGKVLAHTCYAAEFTAGTGAAVAFSHLEHPSVTAWVARFVEAYGFSGQIAFDFIEAHDGSVRAIECNPRTTSGVHLLAQRPGFAATFLAPETVIPFTAQESGPIILTLPMLIYGLPTALRQGRFEQWLHTFSAGTDAIWKTSDIRPALAQLPTLLYLAGKSLCSKKSLLEISTVDIEWNGN